jgi:hypothetical protein
MDLVFSSMLRIVLHGEPIMMKTLCVLVLGLSLLPSLCLASGPTTSAAAECLPGAHEVPLASATGSVGIMKNLAEDPGSIRAIAGRLLADALRGEADAVTKTCDAACLQREKSEIVYRVAPTAYLAADLQRDECRKFESETRNRPLTFDAREFHSVEELNEWITALARTRRRWSPALRTLFVQLQPALHLPHRRAEFQLCGENRSAVRAGS